jgi:alkylation response protein AidB-like acyl-CoA dehydrogenase
VTGCEHKLDIKGSPTAEWRSRLPSARVAMEVTTVAVQLFGRAGYTTDFRVERMMRDAKIIQIWERHQPDATRRHVGRSVSQIAADQS